MKRETIKIDRNIPIDMTRYYTPRNTAPKYPLLDMKIGDSFAIPVKKDKPINQQASRLSTVIYLSRKKSKEIAKMKFITRTSQDKKTIRVWRIK